MRCFLSPGSRFSPVCAAGGLARVDRQSRPCVDARDRLDLASCHPRVDRRRRVVDPDRLDPCRDRRDRRGDDRGVSSRSASREPGVAAGAHCWEPRGCGRRARHDRDSRCPVSGSAVGADGWRRLVRVLGAESEGHLFLRHDRQRQIHKPVCRLAIRCWCRRSRRSTSAAWDRPTDPRLGVQYWFLFVGFVLSASFLLRRVVSAWLAWGFLALAAVIPELDARLLGAQADWALDLFYALAGIAVLVWLRTGERC